MDTKRCPRCNKLLRFDAQICSRCGMAFSTIKEKRKRVLNDTDYTITSSQPTNPPASPHQVGHYSGLHPEDQPFQSSFFMPVLRPVTPEPRAEEPATLPQPEPIPFQNPNADFEYDGEFAYDPEVQAALEYDPEIQTAREYEPETLRGPVLENLDEDDFDASMREFAALSTRYPRQLMVLPEAPNSPDLSYKPAHKLRLASVLLTVALICFLLASSLLTFLLLSKSSAHVAQPVLLALPGEVRIGDTLQVSGSAFHAHSTVTMTRDAHIALLDPQGRPLQSVTDSMGRFQARILITAPWSIGTHRILATDAGTSTAASSITVQAPLAGPSQLHLGISRLDLGADKGGTISRKTLTLTNTGGGEVSWQASSDVSWLTLEPASGTFAGSTVVTLTVQRTNLVPQAYLGQIIFAQLHGNSQILHISMTVNTTSASLVLSSASLAFTGTTEQSPAPQTITIQNSGGQSLNWVTGITTSDGGNWLSLTPSSGQLETDTSAVLTVSINTLSMAAGAYQGSLSLSYAGGPAQQVAITLTVTPPLRPAIQVTPQTISFAANQGIDPASKSITITDTGTAPLDWSAHTDTIGENYLALLPARGSVEPGQSMTLTIAPVLGDANGQINSTITIADSDQGSDLPPQQIKVSINITNEPVITLDTGTLEFDHDSVITNTSSLLIFSNGGNQALNWSITQSSSAPWLTLETTSGSLDPGDFGLVNIQVISSKMAVGTYTLTLTLKDSDSGSPVTPQQVTIVLVVSA